ncbi:MAG: hypothetical protein KIT69_12410, partial [Propionibacteriaceae bacterium]|nr:hypothetical protein [Propionibacteriaceae bacterium]
MSRAGSSPARRLWPVAVLTLLPALLAPAMVAVAASADQSALCDGAPDGCSLVTGKSSVNAGQSLDVTIRGNPGVETSLRLYLIEFNSDGAITGLTPQGPAQRVTTSDSGRADLEFSPGAGDGDASS